MKRSISVIITTHNEADNIVRALESIKGWVDDIFIVDSFSTDKTIEIAQSFGARIEQRKYTGPANQKNWAIPQAKYEWILLLDADEEVTEELKREIQQLLARSNPIPKDVYWIRRNNFFLGKAVRFSGWQGDKVVRFFHRDKARYNAVQVHEEIITTGLKVGTLYARLDHYTFRNLDHYLDKTRRYARWSAKDHSGQTLTINFFHLGIKPLFRFFKHFLFQQGFRDGKVGFIVSAVMAWGVFLRYVYMKEQRAKLVKK